MPGKILSALVLSLLLLISPSLGLAQDSPSSAPNTSASDTTTTEVPAPPASIPSNEQSSSPEAATPAEAPQDQAPQETTPTSQETTPAPSEADLRLHQLWRDNATKYTTMAAEIEAMLTSNDSLGSHSANVLALMAEFNRYRLIFQTSVGHPSEQEEVLGSIKQLRQKLNLELAPLETNLNNLNLKLVEATNTKESLDELLESGEADLVEYEKILNQAVAKLQKAQSGLNDTINPIKSALETLDKSIAEIETKIPSIWQSYYFGESGLGGLFQINNDFFSWVDSFSSRLVFLFPQDKDTRSQALFRFIITLAIMILVGYILLSNAKKIPESFRELLTGIIKGPWITASFGLAFIAASMTQLGGNYLFIKLPGILMVIRALATISWKLRIWTNPDLKDKHSPLHRFYIPAALGVAFLFFDLPANSVTVVWIITMGFFLYYLSRTGKGAQKTPKAIPEYIAYGSGFYFAFGSLLVTVFGYSRLAILVFMCLFALGNIIILGSALVSLTGKICNYVFPLTTAPIKNALANALAVPCSFLLSLVSALPWLLAVPGSTNLLNAIMNRGYSVGSASISFYRVFFIVILLLLFRSMGGLANTSLAHLSDKFSNLKSGIIQSLRTLMNYIIWCLFAVIALSLLGVNFSSIILAATGFSVGISMGLQSIVNNLFSGLILILGGNVQIDNLIEVDGVIGKVVGINIRCTVIEPADNSWVYVPNSSLVNGRFINWTRNNRLVRRKLEFRTVYGTDIPKAKDLMMAVAMRTEYVAKMDPYLPAVTVVDLSENAVILTLSVTILDIDQNATVQSELREAIYQGFNENNIDFYIGSSLDISLTQAQKTAALAAPASAQGSSPQGSSPQGSSPQGTSPAPVPGQPTPPAAPTPASGTLLTKPPSV